jgi:hypothetical protein
VAILFCENCGNEIGSSNFCGECGNKISVNISNNTNSSKNKLSDEFILENLSKYCSNEDSFIY